MVPWKWPVQSEVLLPAALQTTMGSQLYQKVQETMEEGTKGISCNAKVSESMESTEGVKWQEVSEKTWPSCTTGPSSAPVCVAGCDLR
ncbi:hypothetical protein CRUP_011019, partial [Coryphaenoides rupestris]